MTAKSELLDNIRRCFSIWSSDLKLSGKANRLSDNISSEDIAAGLLNLIYGYNLRNANEIHPNHKAVDLVDTEADGGGGVAVQISTSNTRQKALKTMKGFCDASAGDPLCDEYSKLIFLILTTDDKFSNWEALCAEDYTLEILNLTDLSKGIEHRDLDKLEQILEYLKRELGLNPGTEQPRDRLSRVAQILDAKVVSDAAGGMTDTDEDRFYLVDLNFPLTLRVVSKGADIPHKDMHNKLLELCATGRPAILTGNSGTGKSIIMLHAAVSWAKGGDIAIWLSPEEGAAWSDTAAKQFYDDILNILPSGKRALLCLDSPSLWPDVLRALRQAWPNDPRIRLLLAERSNRLSRMTDANGDLLHHWFDGAAVAAMMFENRNNPLRVKDYPVVYIPDTYQRRRKILEKSVAVMFRRGVIRTVSQRDAVQTIMGDYNKGNVSLVELIYRAQFWLKDFATRPENLRMDWDEWKTILRRELGIRKSAQQLYGVIALCQIFEIPITVSLFCRHFEIKEYDLVEAMHKWRMQKHVEPVCFQEGSRTLTPKHAVVADLFFLFHRDTLPVNELMAELLGTMDEFEIEAFLEKNVWKKPIQKGFKGGLRNICYRDHLMAIYHRNRSGACGLYSEGKARLALGLLYTVPKKDRTLARQTLPLVEELDPGLDGSVLTASLYTEWGRLLADLNQKTAAEDRFRAVLHADSKNIHSRTELGRLLAKQPGREKDAESLLLETIKIKPDDIQSRTELGRLLAKQPGRETEAEQFLREAIRIDPQNLHPHTELGRLLAKLPGREKDAESLLLETIKIKPDDIQSRTELGRLLAKLPGREKDAESLLLETIKIKPDDIQSRTELGRLLAKLPGRETEAEHFLREAIRIDPQNLHPHTELGRLLAKLPGRETEAERFLREAIRIDPQNLHPHTELGRLLAKQPGRETEAEHFLREILRFDPENIQSRTELGRLLAKLPGRETEAEQFLREILRFDPENIQSRTELGRLLAKLPGRETEAEQFLREAFRINSLHLHSRIELAKLCIHFHRYDEAEQLYHEVLRIDPSNRYARDGLQNL